MRHEKIYLGIYPKVCLCIRANIIYTCTKLTYTVVHLEYWKRSEEEI